VEFQRLLEKKLRSILERGKSVLLLGPRQTGKTTLVNHFQVDKKFTLANPKDRLRYEKDPSLLTSEIEYLAEKIGDRSPLIVIDEVQKLPILMDAAQDLIDRKRAQFILTGSSARKLQRAEIGINLLPGRVMPLRMDPLTYLEAPKTSSLEDFLLEGSLPEILLQKTVEEKIELLEAYVVIYLEQEVRAEALVRDLGGFGRFLELAASESGKTVNFSKLSQEIGISNSTLIGYYQILEDCLIVERIEPLIQSKTRKKLSRAQKYLFFDLGVRRIAAREGRIFSREQLGQVFEQWVGLELIRQIRLLGKQDRLRYWSDPSGPEVDWVLESYEAYIPIEVKWTDRPRMEDARHLQTFLKEYPKAQKAYVICNTPHPLKLSDQITALPWNQLAEVLKD